MIGFSLFRRRGIVPRTLPVLALVCGGLLTSPYPAVAQDQPSSQNVIVDDSVLDSLPGGSASNEGPLPAPAQPPLSRVLQPGESAVSSQTAPTVAPDTTVPAAPTTPIESSGLGTEPGNMNGSATATAPTTESQTAAPASGTQTATSANAASADAKNGEAAPKLPIDGMVRVPFEPESNAIPDSAKAEIAPLIEKLNSDYSLRLQVLAYAAGDEQNSTHARGVSLARALAMRGYLTEQGVAVNRMDLRALGNTAEEQPADRIDLIPIPQ